MLKRYLVKSAQSRRGAIAFLLIGLTVSCMLFAATLSFPELVRAWRTKIAIDAGGNSDFVLRINETKAVRFGNAGDMSAVRDDFEYIVTAFASNALLKCGGNESDVGLLTTTVADINKFSSLNSDEPAVNQIIIGRTLAGLLGAEAGSKLTIQFYGAAHELTVKTVVPDEGLFSRNYIEREIAVINHDTMRAIFPSFLGIGYNRYLFNVAFFSTAADVRAAMQTIREIYPDFSVAQTVDKELIADNSKELIMPVLIGLYVALILAAAIVFFLFRVYYASKSAEMFALRYIGVSQMQFMRVLLLGCAALGVVAALFGYVAAMGIFAVFYAVWSIPFAPNLIVLPLALLFGTLTAALLGALPEILRLRQSGGKPRKKLHLDYALIAIGLALALCGAFHSPAAAAIGLVGILIFMSFAVPLLYSALSRMIARVCKSRAGFCAVLCKSGGATFRGAAVILALGFAVISIINTGESVLINWQHSVIAPQARITVSDISAPTDALIDALGAIEGVEGVYPTLNFTGATIGGITVSDFAGIRAADAFALTGIGEIQSALSMRSDAIVLSFYFERVLKLRRGDAVKIVLYGRETEFIICGFAEIAHVSRAAYVNLDAVAEMTASKPYSRLIVDGGAISDIRSVTRTVNAFAQFSSVKMESVVQKAITIRQILQVYRVFLGVLIASAALLALALFEYSRFNDYKSLSLLGMSFANRRAALVLRLVLLAFSIITVCAIASVFLHTLLFRVLLLFGEYRSYTALRGLFGTALVFILVIVFLALPLSILRSKTKESSTPSKRLK